MLERKWFVTCLCTFLVQFTVFGVHQNFGIMFHELLKVFHDSPSAAAWIGSLAMGATFMISPFGNMLMSRIGFQVLVVVGTVSAILCFIASSFAQHIYTLSVTYGLFWGFSAGIVHHASMVSLQIYSRSNLSLANGIGSSGAGIGTFAVGPLLTYLIEKFQFRWTLRLLALFPLFFIPSVFLIKNFKSPRNSFETESIPIVNDNLEVHKEQLDINRNPKTTYNIELEDNENINKIKDKKSNRKSHSWLHECFDRDLWRHKPYVMMVIGFSILLFGYFIPFTYLVEHALSNGVPMKQAQFLFGLLSVVGTVLKIVCGIFIGMQKIIDCSTIFLMSLVFMAFSHFIAAFATEYIHFVCYAVCFGICDGIMVGQFPVIVGDLIPNKDKIGVALANLFGVMSLPMIAGPSVAGQLAGSSGRYRYRIPFFVAAGVTFVGAITTSSIKLMQIKKTSEDKSIEDENSSLNDKKDDDAESILKNSI